MLKEVLTVSALIAVVLLVRAIFKNRVPKRMIYALWLVVLLKLCLRERYFLCRFFHRRTQLLRCRLRSCPHRLHR